MNTPITRTVQSSRVYASWRINTPVGPIEGDDIYNVAFPLDEAGLDSIKVHVAKRATDALKPQAAKAGQLLPALPPKTVLLLCVVPLAEKLVLAQ